MKATASTPTMATIDALLAATPPPPQGDIDIADLLSAAAAMTRAREEILADAQPAATDPSLLAELEARQNAWNAALADARSKLSGQQTGVRGLRAYASHVR